jgi:hypothetical protein
MTQKDLAEVLRSLALKGAYRQLKLATEPDLDGFKPSDDCHGNATKWVVPHPQHKIIDGFLVINDCVFDKHSVIDTGCPKLLDITPRNSNESLNLLRFIEFDGGSRALFDAMPNQVIWRQE